MNVRHCPGWRADHLSGWLAAVGATVLADGLTLAWTREASPYALVGHPDNDPIKVLSDVWPSVEKWRRLPLPLHPDPGATTQKRSLYRPDWEHWTDLARRTRIHHSDGLLPSATHTDVVSEKVSNKPIPSPATGPIAGRGTRGRSAHHKAQFAVAAAQPPDEMIERSAAGRLPRSARVTKGKTKGKKGIDGWGVDPYRLMPSEAGGEPTVEPVIETLTLWGLAMLPVTATGNVRVTRRGRITNVPEPDILVWPAWSQPLDRHGIDALLDAWRERWRYDDTHSGVGKPSTAIAKRLGVTVAWRSRRIESGEGQPPDKGYASELIFTAGA